MPILIDTSVLLASAFSKDQSHAAALNLMTAIAERREQPVILLPVLIELFHIARRRVSYDRAVNIVDALHQRFEIETLLDSDIARLLVIQRKYADAKLDFTDAAIIAVSERLNITRVATLDRRDFSMVRPAHTTHYELLP